MGRRRKLMWALLAVGAVLVPIGLLVAFFGVCQPQPGGVCAFGYDPFGGYLAFAGALLISAAVVVFVRSAGR